MNSMTGIRSRVCAGLTAGMLTVFAGQLQAAPGVLSQLPLFLANPVQPNIFFLLDDSGSMDWEVLWRAGGGGGSGNLDFTPDNGTERLEHCSGYNVLAYDPTKVYTPWYGLDMNGDAFANSDPTNARVNPYTGDGSTSGCDNSGEVNNGNGRTCDLVAGFGGNGGFYFIWTDSDGDDQYDNNECDTANPQYVSDMSAEQRTNYANWFSYYRKREYVMKRAVSQIVDESTERMGFGTINRNNHVTKGSEVGTQVKDIDDLTAPINATAVADKATLLDNLLGVNSSSGTPLRLGLQHTGQYFMDQMNSAALFGYTPTDQSDSANGSSPILRADLGGTCQQNFAIVMSDGYWNGGDPAVGNTDADGPGDFDGQSYADGVGRTLADVAMNYYETDLSPLADEVPAVATLTSWTADQAECNAVSRADGANHPNCYDNNTQQHLVTYTVAFGVRGTIPENNPNVLDGEGNPTPCLPLRGTSLSSQNWPTACQASLSSGWPTPAANQNTTVDDMMHAAWNGRGEFLSAKDPDELIRSLREAISSIASKVSVAAAAVSVDSTSIREGANVVQGKFDSTYWSGELYSYTIDADGTISATPTWAAGELLTARGYASRTAVTYNGDRGIPFAFPANYTVTTNFGTTEISQEQVNDLLADAPYPIGTTDTAEIAENQAHGEKLVRYLLGESTNEETVSASGTMRYRDGHKLGDIVHSGPTFVGDPDPELYYSASYQTWANDPAPAGAKGRQGMIYVGANDGGLHAFNADTGEEVFVYFPQAVFSAQKKSGLHYLADPAYEHRYYVDGTLTVAEVYADVDGTGTAKWHTILVGMLRGGGRSVFAIDVSDPSEFATATGVASNILWEFSDDELGYTYGEATIAKLNNGRWAAIFGNGYIQGASATGEAALIMRYVEKSATVPVIISTGVGSNAAGDCLNAGSACNGLAAPAVVDLGGDYVADRVYAGDLMGNMWAINLASSNPSAWGLAYSASPLFTATSATLDLQPITSQPEVILHPTERHSSTNPNTMVYFGTGQYIVETDPASTASNSFYGIWDSGSPISGSRNTELVEQTITQDTLAGKDIRIMSNHAVDYAERKGWFVDLPDTGERVVYNPLAFGNIIVYNTIVPEENLCSTSGGYSWLMVHSLIDGSEPAFIALDVTGDGDFDEQDQLGDKNVSGIRSGSLNGPLVIAESGAGQGIALTPAEDIDQTNIRGGRLSGSRSSWGRFQMK